MQKDSLILTTPWFLILSFVLLQKAKHKLKSQKNRNSYLAMGRKKFWQLYPVPFILWLRIHDKKLNQEKSVPLIVSKAAKGTTEDQNNKVSLNCSSSQVDWHRSQAERICQILVILLSILNLLGESQSTEAIQAFTWDAGIWYGCQFKSQMLHFCSAPS